MSPLALDRLRPSELSFDSNATALPFVVRANAALGATREQVMGYFR